MPVQWPVSYMCYPDRQLITFIEVISVEGSGVPRNFVRVGWGWVQQTLLRKKDRGNWDLGAVAPTHGFWRLLEFGTNFFLIVNFLKFWYFKDIYDDNQFTCHC
jgi:hypothetical protein